MRAKFMTRGRRLGSLGLLLVASLPSRAATIRVPQDAPTIQAGVDLAIAGDTVLVDAGSWSEAVVLSTRTDLIVKGLGSAATSIQAPGVGPAFTLTGCANITIEGFRLSSVDFGGDSGTNAAISIDASTPVTVHHVLITAQAGNGILVHENSHLHAYENIIVKVGDDAISFRGGTSDGVIHDNTLADNGTAAGAGAGSAIGVYSRSAGTLVVFNNISYGNDYGIAIEGSAILDHDFNLVGGSIITDCYNCVLAANEQNCPPDFVDPLNLDYHIASTSCAVDAGTTSHAGTPAASLDIDGAPKPAGVAPEQGADEIGCLADLSAWQDYFRICEGDTVQLDSTTLLLWDCPTTPNRTWSDDALAAPVRDVTPLADTIYEVTADCPSLPGCRFTRTVLVEVDHRPKPFIVTAQDVAPCNAGIIVSWEAAVFYGPGGRGTYSVYRSDVSCAAARAASALASGLTTTQFVDLTALPGIAYFYAIEAEDDATASTCLPGGPNNGGATTLACASAAVMDAADLTPPADPGAAVLRARHVGQQVTMLWPTSRALLSDEHFHLVKTWGRPTGGWSRANPERDLSLLFTETDISWWLQCFLIRTANACETESP